MTRKKKPVYRKLSRLLVTALCGQCRTPVTLLVYGVAAVLLLTYVSGQVYAGALSQKIAVLKSERHEYKEKLNLLTSEYVGLTSRGRVTNYCKNTLGMIEAKDGSLERFAVGFEEIDYLEPADFTSKQPPLPAAYGFTLNREGAPSP
ncbi:MAG: hypothetical protein O7D32_11650 [bacterium]|nr:hypothetical protein [bacterium]